MNVPDLQTCHEHGERMASIEKGLEGLQDGVASLKQEIAEGFAGVHATLEEHYVRREEFEPVRTVVYGALKVVLGMVLVAIVGLVIVKAAGG